ncbi:lipid-binding protein [Lewinellaceae bacterium SD302]|nr:lipid-binding protein [Lewinellaceae bacterium SD302]
MKNLIFTLIAISSIALIAFTGPVVIKSVDTAKSTVTWKGYKVTGSHEGTIDLAKGDLLVQDGELTGGNFTIDVTSLKVTDITGGGAQKLEGHLKSDDFFGVADHPTANLVITKVAPRGTEGSYKVTGDITIKGTTKEIRFNTQLTEEMGQTVAVADIELDRTDFGLRYGSGSFFDNLGDKTIYDEFELSIRLVAGE